MHNILRWFTAVVVSFAIFSSSDTNAQTTTFSYTGGMQSYVVPAGVTRLSVDAQGAKGGDNQSFTSIGGNGARVVCELTVTPGQVLDIYVGGRGNTGAFGFVLGGYNGGGTSLIGFGGSGGGATDVRTSGGTLANRLIVAGGGAGAGFDCNLGGEMGGVGGGIVGGNGQSCGVYSTASCGAGGTATAGGAGGTSGGFDGIFGVGGDALGVGFGGGGAGGGGYYGGGGGFMGSGGGGSSFTNPLLTSVVTHTSGFNSGDGRVVICPYLPSVSISGPSTGCVGGSISFTASAPGGVWSSSNIAVAVVGTSGVVYCALPGAATISYTISNSCGTTTATAPVTFSLSPSPGTISGTSVLCAGTFTTLSTTGTGGVWSVTNSNATISTSGILTGVTPGLDTVLYTVTSSCGTLSASFPVNIGTHLSVGAISGPTSVCQGSSITLTDTSTTGAWSASDTIVSVTGGVVTGRYPGPVTIYYIVTSYCGSAIASYPIVIDALPDTGNIVGRSAICSGVTDVYTNAAPGGMWSASNTNATITTGGVLTANTPGLDTLYYTVGNSCGMLSASKVIVVGPSLSAGTLTGSSYVCIGAPIRLTNPVLGGTWSASNSNAVVVAGYVSGVTTGVDTIYYTVTSSCGTAVASKTITVNEIPAAGTIVGPGSICTGSTGLYTNAAPGGFWTMSNPRATVSSGVVTPVSVGLDTIIYRVSNICGSAATTLPIDLLAAPIAGSITGPTSVCVGSTITLFNPATGGVWSANNTNVSVVGGVVTGLAAGSTIISYSVTNTCGTAVAVLAITVNPLPDAGVITGASSVCVASTITLSNVATGGIWSMSNTNATINTSGDVTGVTGGPVTASYTVTNSCGVATATLPLTINSLPFAGTIAGLTSVCEGATVALTDAAPGGVWSITNPSATIATDGVVTGVVAGLDTVNYTVTNVCGTAIATVAITVNPLPNAGTITGLSSVCVGSSITLTDLAPGGSWSAGNANATVSPLGVVSGVRAGTTPITYTVANMCGTAWVTTDITINPLPNAGTITGATDVCVGANTTLSNTASGGIWSSTTSNTSITTGGVVTGLIAGADVIEYTVTNMCGTAVATYALTINDFLNPGTITGASGVCVGSTITLANTTSGGVWSMSNPRARVTTTGVVTGLSSGVDTALYTVTNMCGSVSASKVLVISPIPNVGTITGGNTVCEGGTLLLSDGAAGGTWSTSNTSVATINSLGIVTGIAAGAVNIAYTVTNSCGSRAANLTVTVLSTADCNTVSVNTVNTTSDVKLYPNPNTGNFTINGKLAMASEDVTIEITNMVGQVIYKSIAPVVNGSIDQHIQLNGTFANGMYLLTIRSASEKATYHFVMEH